MARAPTALEALGVGVHQSAPLPSRARLRRMYAFDVHCNSYFPLFLQLYVVQYLLCPLLLRRGFLAVLLSNALYGVALSYYHYTQFLGYSGAPPGAPPSPASAPPLEHATRRRRSQRCRSWTAPSSSCTRSRVCGADSAHARRQLAARARAARASRLQVSPSRCRCPS